jgi:hypothetical protein
MAILKTNINNKIITKNGLPACTCCESDNSECCLYSARLLAEQVYPSSDLPDSIKFIAIDLQAVATNIGNNEFRIPNGFGPGEDIIIGLSGEEWRHFVRTSEGDDFLFDGSRPCLSEDLIPGDLGAYYSDTFLEEYFFSDPATNAQDVPVVRSSRCEWVSDDWISYTDPSLSFDYISKAFLTYVTDIEDYLGFGPAKPGFALEILVSESPASPADAGVGAAAGYKADPQSSPIGTYIMSFPGGERFVSIYEQP